MTEFTKINDKYINYTDSVIKQAIELNGGKLMQTYYPLYEDKSHFYFCVREKTFNNYITGLEQLQNSSNLSQYMFYKIKEIING